MNMSFLSFDESGLIIVEADGGTYYRLANCRWTKPGSTGLEPVSAELEAALEDAFYAAPRNVR